MCETLRTLFPTKAALELDDPKYVESGQEEHCPRLASMKMTDRVTKRASGIIASAEQEAAERNDAVVRPDHLLLALLREGQGTGATVLLRLGLDAALVESALDRALPRNANAPPSQPPPWHDRPEGKAAIEEAIHLGHGYVGTEHLMLGLIRSATGTMAAMFADVGITQDKARAELLALWREIG
jgi:ATP-dependent Clp protease ATP-binding subunit ClpC